MPGLRCPICDMPVEDVRAMPNAGQWDCPRCGPFSWDPSVGALASMRLQNKQIDRSVMSHRLRSSYEATRTHSLVTMESLQAYELERTPPNPQQQLDNLVLWIGQNQRSPAQSASKDIFALLAIVGAQVSDAMENEFDWLLHEAQDQNLFECTRTASMGRVDFRLTMQGWSRFEVLSRTSARGRKAFMAMKFGQAELDQVVNECFKPAVQTAGFDLFTVAEEQPAGLIDNQIRAAIRESRLVIADLTHKNNGAYFEAGFGEALGLPVIYTCKKSVFDAKGTHFDTNHMVTIPWAVTDLMSAQHRLTATIRATLPCEAKFD